MASILSSIATRASIIRRWGQSSIVIISLSPIITPDNPLLTAEESAISGNIQKPDICMVLEKGRFKQIHEWYNHQGFDVVGIDDFIHISEYLIQSTYG